MKIMKQVLAASEVMVNWIEDDSGGYVYEAIPASLNRNEKIKTIRFELREVNGDDRDFEVVVFFKESRPYAKIDYPDFKGTNFALTPFKSDESTLLFLESGRQKAYFHFR